MQVQKEKRSKTNPEKRKRLNVDLGTPYISIIDKAIEKGYAQNMGEVIRHALKAYEREINLDEDILVTRTVRSMMEDVKSGKTKTYDLEDVLKEEDKRRDL
ncbi:MAG: type II toxin-antitoxin system ParD family antitoxin [Methanocella sp.]